MKTCTGCRVEKPAEDFYAQPSASGGRMGKCKVCHRAAVAARRSEKIEDVRAYDRERARRPERLAHITRNTKAWRKAHPDRARAHRAVQYALKTGVLQKQPCERCRSPKAHAHHDDYTKPLDVRWLCAEHHAAHHRAERTA